MNSINLGNYDVPFYASRKTPMWRRFSAIGGLLSFGPEETGGDAEFAEAKSLFKQGRDVPRILELLAISLDSGPCDYTKWTYLGRTLAIAHKPIDALLAFDQALRSGAPADDIFPRMLPLLEENAFPTLASGVAWHIYLDGEGPEAEKARIFIEKHCGNKLP